jgi:hypothetical protein
MQIELALSARRQVFCAERPLRKGAFLSGSTDMKNRQRGSHAIRKATSLSRGIGLLTTTFPATLTAWTCITRGSVIPAILQSPSATTMWNRGNPNRHMTEPERPPCYVGATAKPMSLFSETASHQPFIVQRTATLPITDPTEQKMDLMTSLNSRTPLAQ